jgi:hypothetical protein
LGTSDALPPVLNVHTLSKEFPMKLGFRHALTGILAVATLVVASCADVESPTSISREQAHTPDGAASRVSAADLDVLAEFTAPRSVTIALAKKWIGPEGGRLDFEGFAIEVPAGAVSKVTQFSIRLPVDTDESKRVIAEFGPHQTFAAPVAIELPYAGTSVYGLDATVVWWNPDASVWEDVGGAVTADGQRMRTETDHFSEYGTAEDKGDTVILSGG